MFKAETQPGKGSNVSFLQHSARIIATTMLSPTFLRSETTNNDGSIGKAKEALRSGKGLVVVINHFSLKDPPQATSELFHHKVTGSKKITAPIALHRDSPWFHRIGRLLGYNLVRIVTESTIKEGKNDGLDKNDGLMKYISNSTKLLKNGGIVILAPQGTRMSQLGQPNPNNPVVGALMASAKRDSVNDYVFLFMGLGIKGVKDYSGKKTRGFNPLKKYTLEIGACLTDEEVMEKANILMNNASEEPEKVSKKTKNPLRFVDTVIFDELRKVCPPNYR